MKTHTLTQTMNFLNVADQIVKVHSGFEGIELVTVEQDEKQSPPIYLNTLDAENLILALQMALEHQKRIA